MTAAVLRLWRPRQGVIAPFSRYALPQSSGAPHSRLSTSSNPPRFSLILPPPLFSAGRFLLHRSKLYKYDDPHFLCFAVPSFPPNFELCRVLPELDAILVALGLILSSSLFPLFLLISFGLSSPLSLRERSLVRQRSRLLFPFRKSPSLLFHF